MSSFDQFDAIELVDEEDARDVQEALFSKHLEYLAKNSPYYRELFEKEGIRHHRLGLADLPSLPALDKAVLEERNDDFVSVPAERVSDIVLSSGTTGRPTRIMYSEADMDRLAYNEKVAFMRLGVTPEDIVLLTCTLDRCFVAGIAYYSGVRALGAAAVRNGLNTVESHRELIERLNPTVLVGVPSFLHKLGLCLKSEGIDPAKTSVDKLVGIGEPLRGRDMRFIARGAAIEDLWQARAYSTYASSETVTTACECTEQRGGHLHPALAVVEILDEEGRPRRAGEVGEVTVTPLQVEAMPLLRFKTGDISFLMDEPCRCGRRSMRLGPILGRKKQMIKLHGTTLYPQAVFSVLDEIPEIADYYLVADSDYELCDTLEVNVAVRESSAPQAGEITERLRARLRVAPSVVIRPESEVRSQVYSENQRKPVRFIDRRAQK